jgi:hemerythrin
MLDSAQVDKKLRRVWELLQAIDSEYAESNFKWLFIYNRYTTGNEWLDEAHWELLKVLNIDKFVQNEELGKLAREIVNEIEEWFKIVKLTGVSTDELNDRNSTREIHERMEQKFRNLGLEPPKRREI